jgi:starch-binding outer membrane protein SusE/F
MKNILKNTVFALFALALGSCEDTDNNPVAFATGGPKLSISNIPAAGLVLDQAAPDALIASLNWEAALNGGVATESSYQVQIAKTGTDFADKIVVVTTSNKFANLTNKQLNDLLPATKFPPFVQTTLDVRVVATLGSGANNIPQNSNVIKIKVTPYTTDLPKIGVPGNHQGWTPSNAATLPLMASSGFGMKDFEGYMTLNTECKFLAPKADGTFDWGTQDWADDGTFAGTLTDTNETNLSVTPGYYLVKANTATTGPGALQYSVAPIVWHITGDATPLGWPDQAANGNNSTAMNYDTSTKKWTITIMLTGGKDIKFRANNSWSLNIGTFDASKTGDKYGGKDMSYDGGNIRIATTGTYTVTLDMSNPRAYKYSIN